MYKRSFYQDRLGTNIGKALKKLRGVFWYQHDLMRILCNRAMEGADLMSVHATAMNFYEV
jgi:hypothetical protein